MKKLLTAAILLIALAGGVQAQSRVAEYYTTSTMTVVEVSSYTATMMDAVQLSSRTVMGFQCLSKTEFVWCKNATDTGKDKGFAFSPLMIVFIPEYVINSQGTVNHWYCIAEATYSVKTAVYQGR